MDLFEVIGVFAVMLAVGTVCALPQLLAGWAGERRDRYVKEVAQQNEIARKVAIAEAAIEARKRGETFVPPADYDRSI